MNAQSRANFVNSVGNPSPTGDAAAAQLAAAAASSPLEAEDFADFSDDMGNIFADGVPSWSIVPPQTPVRRVRQR